MKIFLLMALACLLSACSITHKLVEQKGDNVFQVSSQDMAFSSLDELEEDIRQKAKETCNDGQYEFIPDSEGNNITHSKSSETESQTSMAIANVRCID